MQVQFAPNGNGRLRPDPGGCAHLAHMLDVAWHFLERAERELDAATKAGHGIKEIQKDVWEYILLLLWKRAQVIGLQEEIAPLLAAIENAWKTHVVELDDETHVAILRAMAAHKAFLEIFRKVCR